MPTTEPGCPFCNPSHRNILLQNDLAYVRTDRFPVARGHLLAIPFRHVPSFFEATPEERSALLDLVSRRDDRSCQGTGVLRRRLFP